MAKPDPRPPRPCASCGEPLPRAYPPDVAICRNCDLPRHNTVRDGRYVDEEGEAHPLTPLVFIAGSKWVFAKTMPHSPHEYTVRDLMNPNARRSSCLSHDTFEWFVHHIREFGQRRKYGRASYIYLEIDGWRYWTMGAPPEITTILNRARIDTEPESWLPEALRDKGRFAR